VNGRGRREIASRLRAILGIDAGANLEDLATQLDVEEVSLRMSIDSDSPFPTVDVLAAVARRYGIDPTYLLTGVYNIETHRRALGDPESVADAIREAAGSRASGPISRPTDEPPRLHVM
jgi:transcriptional regulator with XRE-family HTH domain